MFDMVADGPDGTRDVWLAEGSDIRTVSTRARTRAVDDRGARLPGVAENAGDKWLSAAAARLKPRPAAAEVTTPNGKSNPRRPGPRP
jgi:hypothetical protein